MALPEVSPDLGNLFEVLQRRALVGSAPASASVNEDDLSPSLSHILPLTWLHLISHLLFPAPLAPNPQALAALRRQVAASAGRLTYNGKSYAMAVNELAMKKRFTIKVWMKKGFGWIVLEEKKPVMRCALEWPADPVPAASR